MESGAPAMSRLFGSARKAAATFAALAQGGSTAQDRVSGEFLERRRLSPDITRECLGARRPNQDLVKGVRPAVVDGANCAVEG
jgi:hypothetical protein